jgi:chorismate mutase / prephenate dehydratase
MNRRTPPKKTPQTRSPSVHRGSDAPMPRQSSPTDATHGDGPPVGPDLAALRRRIDELDARLVQLLSDRSRLVVEVGKAKRADGTPIYAPHREAQVIARAIANNPGPLSPRTIEAIYRELMSGSFSLELPLRVGYLGPPGSFSHMAAVRHFGSSVELDDLHTIDAVFEEVAAGRVNYGLAPYENSIGGSVTDTLDALQQHEVTIYAESMIEVAHTLLANCPAERICRIHSKPQAFDQCRKFLAAQFPGVELVPAASTAAAAKLAAQSASSGDAAIGSFLAGEIYGVKPLFENIQDKANNITRFVVIAREHSQPSGDDKTSIMFVTAHKPGALVDVLGVFRDAAINLSHIDKRPSGRTNWEYTFYIDCDAHQAEPRMAQALAEARTHCLSLKVLGSYPRAKRIL